MDWNFGDLPVSVEVEEPAGDNTVKLLGYPALFEKQNAISLRVFPTQSAALSAMKNGLRALYQRVLKKEHRYIVNRISGFDALCLIYAPFGSSETLRRDLANAAFDCVLMTSTEWPRKREDFYRIIAERQKNLLPLAQRLLEPLDTGLREYQSLSRRIDKSNQLSWVEPLQDIRDQLNCLFAPGFITRAGAVWLERYPVYLKSIGRRLDAIDKAPEQDRLKRAEYLPLWEQFKQLREIRDDLPGYEENYWRCRWRLEELRVSLFAQSLGTREKVSIARLEQELEKLTKD